MFHYGKSHQSQGKDSIYKWAGVGLLVVTTLSLGYFGFREHADMHHEHTSFISALYHTIQLFALHSPHFPCEINMKLDVARCLGAGVFFYAGFEVFGTKFYEQIRLFMLCFNKNHIIICGLGRRGLQLVKSCKGNGDKVVVIEKDGANDFVRVCRELGIIVLVGDATDKKLLNKAGVHKARYLVAISDRDGTNVEIAVHTHQLVGNTRAARAEDFHCRVHIVDSGLRAAFKEHRVSTEKFGSFALSTFDIYENTARLLFNEHPLDYASIPAHDPRTVHLIIVGFGQMGEAMLLQSARVGHYAGGRRLRATVIDHEAHKRERCFYHRHTTFEQVCDVTFLEMEAEDRRTVQTLEELCKDRNSLVTLAVCFDDDARSLSFALSMLSIVSEYKVPIRVRMAEEGGLATLLPERDGQKQDNGPKMVHIFGTTAHTCTRDMVIDDELDKLARKIHNDYVADMKKQGKTPKEKPAMRAWESLDEDYIDSNRRQADHIRVKLRAIGCYSTKEAAGAQPVTGFTDEEVKLMAEMEHRRWCADRILAGWKLGDKNDPIQKTNPNLKEWNLLDEGTREYNCKTVLNIPHLLSMIGERVYRRGSPR